jgi:hypothetical protein
MYAFKYSVEIAGSPLLLSKAACPVNCSLESLHREGCTCQGLEGGRDVPRYPSRPGPPVFTTRPVKIQPRHREGCLVEVIF